MSVYSTTLSNVFASLHSSLFLYIYIKITLRFVTEIFPMVAVLKFFHFHFNPEEIYLFVITIFMHHQTRQKFICSLAFSDVVEQNCKKGLCIHPSLA